MMLIMMLILVMTTRMAMTTTAGDAMVTTRMMILMTRRATKRSDSCYTQRRNHKHPPKKGEQRALPNGSEGGRTKLNAALHTKTPKMSSDNQVVLGFFAGGACRPTVKGPLGFGGGYCNFGRAPCKAALDGPLPANFAGGDKSEALRVLCVMVCALKSQISDGTGLFGQAFM